MAQKTPGLDAAYALSGPDDNRRLYADWAETYETGFIAETGYRLHEIVAEHFIATGGVGPVLDIGAGTGVVGAALTERAGVVVDGMDLSPDMLEEARAKALYRHLFVADITTAMSLPDGLYHGAVSAGTFTTGHVGPEALVHVLDAVASGGWIVISVNTRHWQAKGFEAEMTSLSEQGRIQDLATPAARIYAGGNSGPHSADQAIIATFRKA